MKILLIISLTIISTSCASILSRKTYLVSLESNPSESNVVVTDMHGNKIYHGKTPSTVSLDASQGFFKRAYYTLSYTKEGYNEMTMPITFGVDGLYWANLFGFLFLPVGIIGFLIVDPLTGSVYRIDSQIYRATLTAK